MTVLATGWRRVIGCLKLQVMSRKRATKYGAFSRKMTYKDKASSESSPPCIMRLHSTNVDIGWDSKVHPTIVLHADCAQVVCAQAPCCLLAAFHLSLSLSLSLYLYLYTHTAHKLLSNLVETTRLLKSCNRLQSIASIPCNPNSHLHPTSSPPPIAPIASHLSLSLYVC